MATATLISPPSSTRPSRDYKRLLFRMIPILLVIVVTLLPLSLIRRLNSLEQSLKDHIQQVNLERGQFHSAIDVYRLEMVMELEHYKREINETINEALNRFESILKVQDLSIHKLSDSVINVQKNSSAAYELSIQAQGLNQELVNRHQKLSDLHARTEQSMDHIEAQIDLHKEQIRDLARFGKQQVEMLEGLKTQNIAVKKEKSAEEVKAEDRKTVEMVNKPLSPSDSSDEDDVAKLDIKDEDMVQEWMQKASETIEDELVKGKEQVVQMMEEMKVVTKTVAGKFGDAGSRIGEGISHQAQKIMEKTSKLGGYAKSIWGTIKENNGGDSDFDQELEL